MIVCIAGKNDIAINCTDWIISEGYTSKENIRVCFNKTDLGDDTFQKSFKKYANKMGLLESNLEDLYDIENLTFISLEFDRIIKPENFNSNDLFNIHFSLLPKYRGMYTSAWPILNGDTHTGVTLHKIDAGIDTGNIIDQLEFPISENDTARDLYFDYIKLGEVLFKNNYKNIMSRAFIEQVQSIGTYYSKSSIDYKNLTINLNKTAKEIRNQIRAFNFEEYQIPIIKNKPVYFSEILNKKSTKQVGEIVISNEVFIDIATKDYDLRLFFNKID